MAMNSSPARIVRESIETPASRAKGSIPCPLLPATASATCATVHRIVSSKGWLSLGFGRGLGLVRTTALFCPFSPVEGSSLFLRVTALARRPSSLWRRVYPAGSGVKPLPHGHQPPHGDQSALRAKPFAAVRRCHVPAIAERFRCHFAIVKVNRVIRKNLVVLVSFAGQQNDVSLARFFNGQVDRFRAVGFDEIFPAGLLHTHHNVTDDFQGILLSRIVAG